MTTSLLIPGYHIRQGSHLDRATLVKFMQRTYGELYPGQDFSHLAQTVEQYLSGQTQLWWVELESSSNSCQPTHVPFFQQNSQVNCPIACLWLGNAMDQVQGDRHSYIFLLYVMPNWRQQGIGTALMQWAETWAKKRGDRQIALQVFQHNSSALNLYDKLGYQPQSVWMTKSLDD
ncbi:MAG: GNAT family N-acetyltransferase [Elainellaceae cyanobacterium]